MSLLLLVSLLSLDYRPVFLDIPAFSSATALGGALTASGEDALAVFYNPAGIDRDGLQFALADWFMDTRLVGAAGSLSLGDVGSLGAGVKYVSFGTLSRRDEEGNYLGDFSAYSLQGKLGYGRRILRRLSVGAGASIVAEKVDSTSRLTLAGDFGARFLGQGWGAGLAVRDLMDAKTPFAKSLGVFANPWRWLLVTAELEHVSRFRSERGPNSGGRISPSRGGFDGGNPARAWAWPSAEPDLTTVCSSTAVWDSCISSRSAYPDGGDEPSWRIAGHCYVAFQRSRREPRAAIGGLGFDSGWPRTHTRRPGLSLGRTG